MPAFRQFAQTEVAPYRDHWLAVGVGGNYGADFRARSAANYAGIWANVPTGVVYFMASRDADAAPLDGARSYVMHFPADGLPQSVADGSLKIGVGPAPVAGVPDANWLPAATGKPFSLTFRAYVPKPEVITGN